MQEHTRQRKMNESLPFLLDMLMDIQETCQTKGGCILTILNTNTESKNIFPVLGRICMDQMMVGLGTDGTAYVNDDVELWGENIKLWEVSKWSGHSMWEHLLANVTERVPRRYIK